MFFAKQHHKKGFTLAETILVVAIIAILLAVAAPNVLAYYRQLKLTGLDDDAKTIFMAAQSRLTAMLSAGEELKPAGPGSGTGKSDESGVAFYYIDSSEYAGLHNYVPAGSIESQLQENNFIVEFVPRTGAVHAVWYWEKDNDNFTYDPTYDEDAIDRDTRLDEMVGYYGGKGIERPELGQMPIPELNIINAEELRLDIKVSKEQIEKALSSGTALDYNKDIFTVDIYVNDADSKMMRIVKDAPLKDNATIDVTSLTGSVVLGTLHTEPDRYKGKTLGGRYYIDGKKFKDWKDLDDGNKSIIYIDPVTLNGNPLPVDYNDKGIHAGNDITVTVVLNCNADLTLNNGSTGRLISQSASAQTNSLFAGLEDNGDGTKTALIAYGRHLQNLHDSMSYSGSDGVFCSGVGYNSNITAAKQIRDINFASVNPDTYNNPNPDPAKSANDIYYWGSTYPVEEDITIGQDGFRNFHEINNSNLTKYDGQHYEIRNMYIAGSGSSVGLFSMLYKGMDLEGITVVNPHIHGEPDTTAKAAGDPVYSYVGALIGFSASYEPVKINECKVYNEYDGSKDPDWLDEKINDTDLDDAKIIVATNDNNYVKELIGVPHIGAPEEQSIAGGLIGSASGNITITNSFCSVPVVGENSAGGLIGNFGGDVLTIDHAYTACFLYGNYNIAGLVGVLNGTGSINLTITNCYAAGEIKLSDPSDGKPVGAGLFTLSGKDIDEVVTRTSIENIHDNYAAVKYVNTTGEPTSDCGYVFGTYKGDEPTDSYCNYYIADPDVTAGYGKKENGTAPLPCGNEVSAADLITTFGSNPKWTTVVAEMAKAGTKLAEGDNTKFTHPYNLLDGMDLQVYPYPMLKTSVEVVNGTGTASTDLPVEHYGDWVEGEDTPSATMVYYETTAGGTNVYGFYKNEDGNFKTTPESGLHGVYVIEDGYALSYPDGTVETQIPDKIKIDGVEYEVIKTTSLASVAGNNLYSIKGLDSVKRDKYYHKVEVPVDNTAGAGVTVFWFNPDLACEVFPDELMKEADGTAIVGDDTKSTHKPLAKTGTGADVGEGVAVVRSARQLAQLGINTNAGTDYSKMLQKLKYEQKMDIDFDKYNQYVASSTKPTLPEIKDNSGSSPKYNHVPVTLVGESDTVRAEYNGNGHKVINMLPGAIVADGLAENGMFAKVKYANIESVTLINGRVVTYNKDNGVMGDGSSGNSEQEWIEYAKHTVKADNIATFDNGKTDEPHSDSNTSSDNYFTFIWGSSSKNEDKSETAEGTAYSRRISFGGSASYDSTNKNMKPAVKFEVTKRATVKVVWRSGSNGRQITLFRSDGTSLESQGSNSIKDSYYTFNYTIDQSEVDKGGVFYIGATGGSNYIYEITVTELTPKNTGSTPTPSTPTEKPDGADIGSAKVRAGMLAGVVDNSNITNCGAYVVTSNPDYPDIDSAYDRFIVKNGFDSSDADAVGGLVGNITTKSIVKNCYSAVKVVGRQKAGGFAGRIADNSEIKDCYVGGHTSEGTYIKLDSSGSLKKSEYLVNVATECSDSDKQTYTGGFVGETDNTVKYGGVCYTTASVGMAYNTFRGSDKKTISTMGQFAGTGDVTKAGSDTTLYASGSTFRKVEDNTKTDTEDKKDYEYFPLGTKTGIQDDTDTNNKKDLYAVRDEKYLNQAALVNDGGTLSAKETKYDTSLGENYPYKVANGQKEHHGDWTNRFQFIYYEVYDKDYVGEKNLKNKLNAATDSAAIQKAVGFYAQIKDMTTGEPTWVNTLHTKDPVLDSGYMILANSKDSKIIFSISSFYGEKQNAGSSTYFTNADAIPGTNIKDQNTNQIAGYLYVIPFEAINLAPSTTYYLKVNINGQPYMLNPFFACEAINVGLIGDDGELDYDTIREKKDLTYTTYSIDHATGAGNTGPEITTTFNKGENAVIIRNAWNLAGMARYTRNGNEDDNARNNAQKYNYHVLMDIDYQTYANGERIYDGNTNARGEKDGNGNYHEWYSGNKDGMGQVSASLNGGTFNGYGHTITNFFLGSDRGEDKYVGLFGSLTGDSTVKDLMIEGLKVNTYGEHSSDSIVSAIAAVVDGKSTVNNIYIDGVDFNFDYKDYNTYKEWVENNNKKGTVSHVGGIVGQLKSGTVSDVTVNSVTIDFNVRIGDGYTGSSIKKPDTNHPNDENGGKAINIGGAIGEINVASGASASVSDVTVIDPTINASRGKDNKVGGFVGSVADSGYAVYSNTATGVDDTRPAEIKNCGVYISDGKKADFDKMGVIANDDDPDYPRIIDGDKVGGFAGYLGLGANVTGDYSAIRVQGIKYAGGFAGYIKGSHVEDCYSGGYVKTDGTYDTTDYNVEADTSDGTAGGFVGKIEVAYQTGSSGPMAMYMTGVNYTTSSVKGVNADKTGLFAGDGTDDAAEALAAKMGDLKPTNYAGGISNVTARKESTVKIKSAMPRKDKGVDFKTIKYNANKDTFPFDTNLTEHHGDWVEYDLMTAGYWEVEDGKLRIYYIPSDVPDSPQERMESGCAPFDHDGRHTDANYVGITAAGYFAAWANDSGKTYSLTGNTSLTEDTDIESRIRTLLGGSTITVKAYDNAKSASASLETWQITGGTASSIEYYVNPAYGRAIEVVKDDADKMGKKDKPYEIRTAQQLDNADGSGMYFRQTHDVAGKEYNGYTPNTLSGGEYDGGSYRILDLKIDAGSDNAALFSALNSGARVVNTILYGTTTTSEPTISGKNAAGIAADIIGEATIENCAVAGYKITGTANVGGLVATVTGGTHVIKNSEATVTREINSNGDNGYIGGLVGEVSGGKLKIDHSYAGGNVTTASGKQLNKNMTNIGGIVGGKASTVTDKIVYDTVYSYVAMIKGDGDGKLYFDDTKKKDSSDFEHVTFYGIGPDVDTDQTDTIGFWSGGIPDPNTDDRALNTALVNLTKWHTRNEAKEVYMPNADDYVNGANALTNIASTTPQNRPFPYGGYVKDAEGNPIHYGDWPVAERYAGLFYWEKERVTSVNEYGTEYTADEYHFYAYGAELVRDQLFESELIDTICHDHHEDERATILKSGYGYFLPERPVSDGIDEFTFAVKNGENVDTRSFAFKNDDTTSQELTEALFDQLFPDGNNKAGYTVQLLDEAGGTANIDLFANVKDFKWEITASFKDNSTESFDMRVYPTFGEAIYGDDFDMGEGNDDNIDKVEPMKIRTREQFERLKANVDNKSLDYIVLTHDIDFAEKNADGYAAGVSDTDSFVSADSNYVPGQIRTRIFDGRSYRLFDVKISVTKKVPSTNLSTTYDLYKKDGNDYTKEDSGVAIIDDYNNPEGDAALFLNNRDAGTTEFRNLIIYSPDGTAVIETNQGGNAAGIIARGIKDYKALKDAVSGKVGVHAENVSGKYTFENCVVAGYTIRGGANVGGLVGEATNDNKKDGGGAPMMNCEVVADLVGTKASTHIGGLAGQWRGDVQNCYTGGTIKLDSGVTASNSTVIGGLVGEISGSKTVEDCYTYVDFTDTSLNGANIYAFGSGASVDSNSYYYDEYAKDVTFKEAQGTETSYGTLASKTAGKSAENSYWPKDNTGGYYGYVPDAMGQFPFGAVASYENDGVTIPVHYGLWPEGVQAAGVAYYEKDSSGKYYVQIVGVKADNTGAYKTYNDSNLCEDHHVDAATGKISTDHQIVESGYAAFTTKPGTLTVGGDCALTGIGDAATGSVVSDVMEAIGNYIGGAVPENGIKVYPTVDVKVTDYVVYKSNMTPSVDVKADATTVTAYYTNGFAGVSADTQIGANVEVDANGNITNGVPIQIRTVQQLDNLQYKSSNNTNEKVDNAGVYYMQTHDLYGETYTTTSGNPKYTGVNGFAGTYDGGSYRILELSMSGSGEGVGLFNTAGGTIKNVIMYSPKGTATITNENSKGSDREGSGAGGIVGNTSGSNLKISNCIVAGYTIKGRDMVGGIVGYGYQGAVIDNCAAVNNLVGTVPGETDHARGMGGIVGASDYDGDNYNLEITNCYAGGTITEADSDTYVGGIIGYDYACEDSGTTAKGHPTVNSSYSYVDLSDTKATGTHVSAIGGSLVDTNSKNNYYLDDGDRIPTGCNRQDTAKSYGDLTKQADWSSMFTDTTKPGKAEKSYVPTGQRAGAVDKSADGKTPMEQQTTTASFPFPEMVQDENGQYVHYGEWPEHEPIKEAVNGIFYWEKHNGGYKVQYIGQNEKGEAKDYNGLCVDRDGTGIEESGFGYFSYGGATASIGDHGAEVDSTALGGITNALTDNGVYEKVTVTAYKTGTTTGNQAWNVTSGSNTVTAYVNNAYATVYKSNTPTEVYIRTYDQLRQMDGSQNYKQTHDIDASASESVTYTPMDLASGKTYNGGGYRILELKIINTGSNSVVGLFSTVKGTVENVVLYSPSGSAEIKGGKRVGGIAGQLNDNGGSIINCVVAGYNITGTEYVGGIVGHMNSSAKGISNSEAVNKLNGSNSAHIGGIAGRAAGKIENCYAGGEITAGGVSGSKLDKYIGGIYGDYNSSKPTVNNCYTYVDLSNVCSATDYNGKLYTIGRDYSDSGCYYASKLPTTGASTQGTALTNTVKPRSPFTDVSANSSYAPKTPSMTGGVTGDDALTAMSSNFPYPAIFTPDNGGTHEHYGTWLTTKSGDPGMPEGPSFEGMMSAAVPEGLMPEALALPVNELAGEPEEEGETEEILPPDTPDAIKPEEFTLPEDESTDDNGDDGHTEIIDIRVSVARVRRVR